ncbi:MAG: DUF4126 domain-containing protein [Anaerolineales bacterium]|jgi:hypothetical protein|nr:DUF4126 domain-containing protein [Anaerolineales bacterium]
MDVLTGIFSAFGLSASAGLNAYIPLLSLALLARFTNLVKLSSPWDTLMSWWVIGLLAVLLLVEIFADKVPAVNHINDIIQSFIRPAAGAIAFGAGSGVVSDMHPVLSMALGLLVAGSVHTVKSAVVRPAVTATTGGLGNTPVSILEDVVSSVVSFLSIAIPILVGLLLVVILALITIWLWKRANRPQPMSGSGR